MSKEKIAKILGYVSILLILAATACMIVSLFTLSGTITSILSEGVMEAFQANVTVNPLTGTISGVIGLRVVGGGLMSTNVSATINLYGAGGKLLLSRSNSTLVSPGEVKQLTMRISLAGVDISSLRGSVRLSFRTLSNLVGIELTAELGGD